MKPPRLIGVALLLSVIAAGISGCSAEHWLGVNAGQTKFQFNPWTGSVSVLDTKNEDVLIEGVDVSVGDKRIIVQRLQVKSNASEAIVAEIERIKAVGEGMQSQVDYLRAMMDGLVGIASEVRNTVNVVSGVVDSLSKVAHELHPATQPVDGDNS